MSISPGMYFHKSPNTLFDNYIFTNFPSTASLEGTGHLIFLFSPSVAGAVFDTQVLNMIVKWMTGFPLFLESPVQVEIIYNQRYKNFPFYLRK